MGRVVWFNGGFVDEASAVVSIFDRGYQLGEGVFATLHAYRGRCFRKARHLAQLAAGAELLGLVIPRELPLDAAAARVLEVAEARVRVTVTDTATSIVAEPLIPPPPTQYVHGVAAVIVAERRAPSAFKSTSYASSLRARREAGEREAIQLAFDGAVACGAMANVFALFGDELATPSLASGCRAGVTRAEVLEMAASVGLRAVERRIEPAELRGADEAFLTNTRIECLPIASIDGDALRLGPRAAELRAALRKRAGA